MKKNFPLLLIFCICFSPNKINAQVFEKNQSITTVGYGYPNLFMIQLKRISNSQNQLSHLFGSKNYTTTVNGYGPLFLKSEYALNSRIALGVSIGYWNVQYTETSNYQEYVYNANTGTASYISYTDISRYIFSSFSAGARMNLHFGTGNKIDPYVGFAIGYTDGKLKHEFSSDNPHYMNPSEMSYTPIPVYLAGSFGIRYYFMKNIGVYTELGLEKWALIQGGLVIKIAKKNKTSSTF
jgi:hypothetical protein